MHGTVFTGSTPNLASTRTHPTDVTSAIQTEVSRGHTHGPFPAPPFVVFRASPLGIVSKPGRSPRLILDLSGNHAGSVNAGIDIQDFPVHYCSIDDAVALVRTAGPSASMAKLDVRHAFRLCPVRPEEWPFLCFQWQGSFYFDSRLPFGLRSSPFIFNSFADALQWCIVFYLGFASVLHYLDDYFICHSSSSACQSYLSRIIALFSFLGVPLAPDKIVGPTSTITFLGIEIDSDAHVLRLPPDKLSALRTLLRDWSSRRTCTKRELLSLIGHLSFAAKVVKPGRLFLRRLIDLSTTTVDLSHRFHLSADALDDIHWWLQFLPEWNGIAYIQAPPVSNEELHLYTDASALGIGGVFGTRWFSIPLAQFQRAPWAPPLTPFNINFWELLALVVAVFSWLPDLRNREVTIHTDNLPLISVWSRGSRNRHMMRLVRALFLQSARANANIVLRHVPGIFNSFDLLSCLQVSGFRSLHPSSDPDPAPLPSLLSEI